MAVQTYLMKEGDLSTDLGVTPLRAVGRKVSFTMPENYADIDVAAEALGWELVDVGALDEANPANIPNDYAAAVDDVIASKAGAAARLSAARKKVI